MAKIDPERNDEGGLQTKSFQNYFHTDILNHDFEGCGLIKMSKTPENMFADNMFIIIIYDTRKGCV